MKELLRTPPTFVVVVLAFTGVGIGNHRVFPMRQLNTKPRFGCVIQLKRSSSRLWQVIALARCLDSRFASHFALYVYDM